MVAPATGRPSRSTTRPVIGTSSRTSGIGLSSVTSLAKVSGHAGPNPGAQATIAGILHRSKTPESFGGVGVDILEGHAETALAVRDGAVDFTPIAGLALPLDPTRHGTGGIGWHVPSRSAGDRLALRVDDATFHCFSRRVRSGRAAVGCERAGTRSWLVSRFWPFGSSASTSAISASDPDQPGEQRAGQAGQQGDSDRSRAGPG